MENKEKELLGDFEDNYENYRAVEKEAVSVIKKVIKDNSFFILDIQHRVKEKESLKGKLIRKSGKYKSIYDITDLVGIRVICYFEDTVDRFAEALSKVFELDPVNSVDKREALQATQFGYLSLHCICNLSANGKYDKELCKIPFEIQIRTVLQHAWAEIEHDLGYKSSFGIPKPIRRDFSKVASLLEIADNEFVSLRKKSKQYTEEIRSKIENDEAENLSVDVYSLSELINSSKTFRNYIQELKSKYSIDVEMSEIAVGYLHQLEWMNIETIGDFLNLFESNVEFVTGEIQNLVENFEIDIITSSAILRMLCEGKLIKENYSETQIRKYLALENPGEDYISRNLKRIVLKYKSNEKSN